jgi:hypothetical protein
MKKQLRKLEEQARVMEQSTDIEFGVFLRHLRKNNSWLPF